MHISEGILPFDWAALWFAVAVPFVALGLKRLNDLARDDLSMKPLVGLMAAVVFVISCMPIPVPTAGTCSHPVRHRDRRDPGRPLRQRAHHGGGAPDPGALPRPRRAFHLGGGHRFHGGGRLLCRLFRLPRAAPGRGEPGGRRLHCRASDRLGHLPHHLGGAGLRHPGGRAVLAAVRQDRRSPSSRPSSPSASWKGP